MRGYWKLTLTITNEMHCNKNRECHTQNYNNFNQRPLLENLLSVAVFVKCNYKNEINDTLGKNKQRGVKSCLNMNCFVYWKDNFRAQITRIAFTQIQSWAYNNILSRETADPSTPRGYWSNSQVNWGIFNRSLSCHNRILATGRRVDQQKRRWVWGPVFKWPTGQP